MYPIVVFDTNVLLSGLGWRGSPYRCLELARTGQIKAITCQELLDELLEKLKQKLNFTDSQITDTLFDLLSFLQVVKISNTLNVIITDPDDNMVLECAVIGHANYIVTGDKKHLLPLKNYQGIEIVNATDFLSLIAQK
ncbi:putative toxin-antitoxin system toxin component, PIN family [Planktothrix sp. FACHB-1365]|uniref:putative toxin-antitoxin system toxin component, PIN family n=1 Tax=Planktothrix sp. FACHB-1365 TaxID=2692855 RepID=UPI0016856293|nr:putative toxin-antitoxin system toxin component, PIN family [Planktothrix sp. FACHB-1365]MBD2481022.1 putative toxin-antitoxin system toxin component, PIN family [Planktothrix sp. FACHB-1365]